MSFEQLRNIHDLSGFVRKILTKGKEGGAENKKVERDSNPDSSFFLRTCTMSDEGEKKICEIQKVTTTTFVGLEKRKRMRIMFERAVTIKGPHYPLPPKLI